MPTNNPDDPPMPCRYTPDPYTRQIPAMQAKLDNLTNMVAQLFDALANATIMQKLNVIDQKLGPQLTGGISTFLKNFWDSLGLQKVLNVLTFVTVLHNAQMLSNSIVQTLFSAFDLVLQWPFIDVQLKDSEGNKIDTSQFVGNAIESFFKSIFGDQTVETVQAVWRRANRIYQAAANIVWSTQSILYTVIEGLEAVGNYVALIGNAARKFGVFVENAYGWMNPNLNFATNRFFRFLDNAQEAAEVIEQVAAVPVEIAEQIQEIQQEQIRLQQELAGAGTVQEPAAPRSAAATNNPETVPVKQFEDELTAASIKVNQPIPPQAEQATSNE
ncbi:hypothetical protein HNI00_07280 [Thermoleptolyngbya oregonensis NK1-22]|uniref:Uncharacterized protein n=1 Tax=Thermoleptolyngbya oregonensis NK1-22 TaxID=2547457 RepID=A0AA96Y6W9_9CYAN|nr:hypothetical protein [Thermoleptolyngbya oregonensis]WOB42978.1 hypothetical protein HNI00_07280 [Thermoleptolyngbya oregonensis NK1-22]